MDDDIALAKPQEERKKATSSFEPIVGSTCAGVGHLTTATTPEPVDDRLTQRERTDRLGICVRVARSRERLLDDGGRGVDGEPTDRSTMPSGCSFRTRRVGRDGVPGVVGEVADAHARPLSARPAAGAGRSAGDPCG